MSLAFDAPTPAVAYPTRRPRRLRGSGALRQLVRETTLHLDDFIYPLFVCPGRGVREEIPSMPGVYHLSTDLLAEEAAAAAADGIPAVLLFGLPSAKDPAGSEAYADDGIVQEGIRAVKRARPDLLVVTDVCLCEYTSHGHCGVIRNGVVDNDRTLPLLAQTALSHARAGADVVAPSDMMDGRVRAVRVALDEHGLTETPIMAYSAKYASAYYGPFREAADSAPQFGDRRGYQMDPANAREALVEVALDVAEGADIVMVKPALLYLDVIRQTRERFPLPLAAYNVSGEYSMIKAAARAGWLDERRAALEALTAIKRAGADLIISYFARDVARWLKEG
jgi:porphobilinogen synthase